MRYEKPVVMDIGARRAVGQGPENCIPGSAAGGVYESCGTGSLAQWSCVNGPVVYWDYLSCMSGNAADYYADCLSGVAVQFYCEVGAGGQNDANGCNVGPSFA